MAFGNMLTGLGQAGAGLFGLLGGNKNPAQQANKYISQIPGQTNPYNQPFFEAGKNMLPQYTGQVGQLLQNPGGRYNEIGQSFQQSPGFKFALEQALGANDRLRNAQGMYGTPMNSQEDMQLATNLANQDYYNYMQGATGLYGQGLQGGQNVANMGQMSGNNIANMIAQALAQQGSNAAIGQMQKNQNIGNAFSNIVSGLGSFFG